MACDAWIAAATIPFASIYFDEKAWPDFPFKQVCTQVDAAEILNLDALQLRRLIEAKNLTFKKDGVALITGRAKVLEFAASYVASAEIGHRTSTRFNHVHHYMRRYPHIGRGAAGWDRVAFDAEFGALEG